jgi:4-hydroxy-3-methylbut-2-enyl diphosphate reductase IspH
MKGCGSVDRIVAVVGTIELGEELTHCLGVSRAIALILRAGWRAGSGVTW